MARTFSTDVGAVGDWQGRSPYYHAPSNRWYRAFRKDGAYYIRRWQAGYLGAEANVLEARVDYAIGSGTHARGFLSKAPDGRLFEMPVTWYSGEGGHWAMSPGFDRAGHADFRREVSPACLACHTAYDAREAVDCARCHGPGEGHRVVRDRSEDVCLQCHLQTTSGALPDSIRLTGRYVPGTPLAEHKLYFDHAPGSGWEGKFEVNSAAYRLRQSSCKPLTCTGCHDPHHARAIDVTAKCRSCHASDHTRRETACAGCHMPKRAAADAPRVTLTDHKIQRIPEKHAHPAAAYRGPVVPYFPVPPLWLAIAQVRDAANLDQGVRQLEPFARRNQTAARELAEAYKKAGRHRDAAEWFRRSGDKAGETQMRVRMGQAPVVKNADDLDTLLALGVAAGQRGKLAESIRWFRRAARLRPEAPFAWLNLAVSLEQSGDGKAAETAYREAIRQQPDFAAAHQHLANLLEARGDIEQARFEREMAGRLD